MRVLHSGSIAVDAGGLATGVYSVMLGLRMVGVDTEIFMHNIFRDISRNTSLGQKLVGEGVSINYTAKPIIPKIDYSPSYKRELKKLGAYDIYHAHGIWQHPTYSFVDVAKEFDRPYIIAPHGMLYAQDIAKSSTLLKKLSLTLRLRADFNNAACTHVTCQQEMEQCRALGIKSPIAVIPNATKIESFPHTKRDDKFRVGYLGRLSPRKNVEGLIYAFANLGERVKDAELLIIGDGDADYKRFLHREISRLGLLNVRFVGFLTGSDKDRAIASLSILAMPSEFENLGNVILEGLVRGIPCIATKGSPWEELATHRCGWWIEYSQDAITDAISSAIDTPPTELIEMGKRGRALIAQNYSLEVIGTKMKSLYEWILTNKNRPDFVYE